MKTVERLYRGGSGTIRKEHFILLYDPARRKTFTHQNIMAGCSKSGAWPLDPQRVLDEIQKSIVNTITTVPTPRVSLDDTQSVQPPETPTTSNALTALSQGLDDTVAKAESLDLVERMYTKRLVNAAENASADRTIMLGENEELFKTKLRKRGSCTHSGKENGKSNSCVRRSSKRKQHEVTGGRSK